MEIISFKKKKMKLLTNELQQLYKNARICYICKEKFEDKYAKDKRYCKVSHHRYYTGEYDGAAHSICNLKLSVPKEILLVFYNGPIYIYHFLIKQPAEKFEEQFTCLGEKAEKYTTFSVPIEKEVTRVDKGGNEIKKTLFYRLQFNDRGRFVAISLSSLVKNSPKLNAKMNMMIKR